MMRTGSDGLAALLLDVDGTLLDTVTVWRTAYHRLAGELDVALPDDFWPMIAGRSMRDSLVVLGPEVGPRDADELIARLVRIAADGLARDDAGWSWLPGARELLDPLLEEDRSDGRTARRGPATAAVTSAWRAFTVPLLAAALHGRDRSLGAVVCGDDVVRSKPSPDPYLRAAELVGVAPADCLVIEDSPTGVAAAEAAGMVVLAVPHAGPVSRAAGRMVRDDLVGLTLEDLAALHARLRSELTR
jgi:beta-phosphoglucomutase-like phosphatase (HAD superfamily)